MHLAVISDSHIPARETSIPEPFRERIAAADHTIHAGDFESPDALTEVRDLASGLTAVHGNADPTGIDLPAVEALEAGGITFVVTHGTLNLVAAAVYGHDGMVMTGEDWARAISDVARARTRAWAGEGVVGIGGHTHVVEDDIYEDVRVLNPGSVTGADPAEDATMMTIDVEDGGYEVTVHEA